jgi:hypothetical protein
VIAAFRSKKHPGSQFVYCEYASMSSLFMTDNLAYRSVSGINQGDTELPDSMAMDISSSVNGHGSFAAGSQSLIGIGNTTAPRVCSYDLGDGWSRWDLYGEWEGQVEPVCFTGLIISNLIYLSKSKTILIMVQAGAFPAIIVSCRNEGNKLLYEDFGLADCKVCLVFCDGA